MVPNFYKPFFVKCFKVFSLEIKRQTPHDTT